MVKIVNLRKFYGTKEILKSISVDFMPGRVTSILGPNACGKTTLIKCILGITVPDSGEILIDNKSIYDNWDYRRFIGYMPQIPDYPENLNLNELKTMLEELRAIRAHKYGDLLKYFELESVLTQQFRKLSGGTKQKIAVVVSLMFDSPILILDEPTAGLDPVSVLRFKNLIAKLATENKTIIYISHIMPEVDQLAQDVLFILDGRVQTSGSVEDVKMRSGEATLELALFKEVERKME